MVFLSFPAVVIGPGYDLYKLPFLSAPRICAPPAPANKLRTVIKIPRFDLFYVGGHWYTCITGRETKSEVPTKKIKKFENRLDKHFPFLYNSNNEANNTVGSLQGSKVIQMGEIQIGSQFTTQKSGVVGTVQEIVKNANGTSRVRLTVNGADRWTTVK